jgi:hypothetical protein
LEGTVFWPIDDDRENEDILSGVFQYPKTRNDSGESK